MVIFRNKRKGNHYQLRKFGSMRAYDSAGKVKDRVNLIRNLIQKNNTKTITREYNKIINNKNNIFLLCKSIFCWIRWILFTAFVYSIMVSLAFAVGYGSGVLNESGGGGFGN